MEFKFKIQNGRLISGGWPYGFTGNVNTYTCYFEIECGIEGLMWFCIFKQGENVYRKLIENGYCIIPQEVLKNPEPLYIGCYGTNADDNIKRVSTNLICFDIKQGAYSESAMPDVPSPDVWETLVSKTIPIIGENGNWFVYDIISEQYIDTGKPSQGSGGGTGGSNGAILENAELFVVTGNATLTDTNYNLKDMSATFEEIKSAYEQGKYVVLKIYNTDENTFEIAPLTSVRDARLRFGRCDGATNTLILIQCSDENEWWVTFTGFCGKNEFEETIGDIETALDNIIAIQNELLGGEGV